MEKLIEQLKRHEGFRAQPYKCTAGKWTIGYGFNLDSRWLDAEGLVWNKSLADYLLRKDVDKNMRNIAGYKFPLLNECRFYALVNMDFNIGHIKKFKKMIEALYLSDYEAASKEMMNSLWSKQVGRRATELAEQMRTGKWQF